MNSLNNNIINIMDKVLTLFKKAFNTKRLSIMMNALFICELIIMFLFRKYWIVVPSRVFQISTELICMAVLIVFYRLHFNKIDLSKKVDKIFAGLCVLLYICIFLDVISWVVDGSLVFVWLNSFTNGSVFILEFIHGLLFCDYIFENFDNDKNNIKRVRELISGINLFAFIIRIILVLSGAYFYVDSEGIYITTDFSSLSFFFVPIMSLFVCGVASGTDIKLSKLATLLSYPLSSLAMAAIALVNIDYANSITTLSLSIILIYCSKFADMKQSNIDLNKSFQTYISDTVLNEEETRTETCSASLLFCNLHGFSSDMEAMEPEDGVIVLNNFYSEMLEVIETNGGKLLEYPGYGLFAIFNHGEHVDNAVNAAGGILGKLEKVNQYNLENHYPKLKLGIGINTGEIVLGNIGSHNHIRYSAIGNHVNLASRTETYANDGEITLTEYTYEQCKDRIDASLIGEFTPKGLSKPISIYRVKGKYVRF